MLNNDEWPENDENAKDMYRADKKHTLLGAGFSPTSGNGASMPPKSLPAKSLPAETVSMLRELIFPDELMQKLSEGAVKICQGDENIDTAVTDIVFIEPILSVTDPNLLKSIVTDIKMWISLKVPGDIEAISANPKTLEQVSGGKPLTRLEASMNLGRTALLMARAYNWQTVHGHTGPIPHNPQDSGPADQDRIRANAFELVAASAFDPNDPFECFCLPESFFCSLDGRAAKKDLLNVARCLGELCTIFDDVFVCAFVFHWIAYALKKNVFSYEDVVGVFSVPAPSLLPEVVIGSVLKEVKSDESEDDAASDGEWPSEIG